jgi:predicted nucleic acid-binding protein
VGLIDDVSGGRVGLDTAPLIYFIERHERYGAAVRPLFECAEAGQLEVVTSGLTLLEVLVVPYRHGQMALADRYEAALRRGRGLSLVALGPSVLRAAALLRARYRVATPDAIQLAAALAAGCKTFVTNDRRLPELPTLRILQLDDYVEAA